MFTTSLFLGVHKAPAVQPVVNNGRTVFYRERAAGMYYALPNACSQNLETIFKYFTSFRLFGVETATNVSEMWDGDGSDVVREANREDTCDNLP
ncbi:hypothetical protein Tco_0860981 [Tanacetum coccineum]|uniref:Uncharacterized protein n=1 Tax=Tanacetum coccineum TaxID=301880 RepID=A0ABQ5BI70_9ASTR